MLIDPTAFKQRRNYGPPELFKTETANIHYIGNGMLYMRCFIYKQLKRCFHILRSDRKEIIVQASKNKFEEEFAV